MRRHVLSIIWGAIWFGRRGPGMANIWTVRAFSGQNDRAWQILDSTCLLMSKSYSSPDDGQYVALWFWPEKTRTVHHLGSYMILTWEGTYCPSSGELYDFNRRGHVLSITCGRDGELYDFDPQMMDSTCHFRSKSYSYPDDGQCVPSTV
jgi:hypothetical protein